MTYLNSLAAALSRSLDVAVSATRAAVRMDVAPTARSHGALPLYALKRPDDLPHFATGADADIGGLSSCRLVLDPADGGRGRFFGTLSTQIPRGGRIERSGYAGFRNKNRPTLFGSQTWDASLFPFLLLRVRNRLPVSSPSLATAAARLAAASPHSSALGTAADSRAVRDTRALHALGIGFREPEPPGPKFFVNVQTDGPVTSDLFQHRLWLHPTNEWQDVIIPFSDFALTNTGQVASSQIQMMREKIRTVGISAVLSSPTRPSQPSTQGVSPLTKRQVVDEGDDWGPDGEFLAPEELGKRGARRGGSYNFDLGIEGVWAVGEDALREPPHEAAEDA